MRAIAISLLAIIWLMAGWTIALAETRITITDPWIREAPPGMNALAGYMLVHNHGDTNISLVSASSLDFDSVMLHETITREKMATMAHLAQIKVPAQKQVSLEPGGMHLMLMKPKRILAIGDESMVTLTFSDGTKVIAKFKVKKPFSHDSKTDPKHHGKHH
uniref:Copper(I)-binding protein n=1 Tax=Candidatus Kentrum sp. SD TaxID=2126332 RepID=A0A450YDX2_9GAMM|nr:MAG: hypothetical protein BECKSD772F_GA0070984_104712 [Candidatus Kentron sp. SD]VFK46339.1 MAG: hypothetical protein BECKSD772E_GA0070983_107111 [Candidatus Kentron sp. SD]